MFNNIRREINYYKLLVDWLFVVYLVFLLLDIVYKLIFNLVFIWVFRFEIIMNFFSTFLGRM